MLIPKKYRLYIYKSETKAMLEVDAIYPGGRQGWARIVIKDGKLFVNQSDEPLNPAIDLDEIRKLIAEYDAICPSEPA